MSYLSDAQKLRRAYEAGYDQAVAVTRLAAEVKDSEITTKIARVVALQRDAFAAKYEERAEK